MVIWRLCDTGFFKRVVSDMIKSISFLMLTLVALSSPLKAQTTEQQEADELAALRYYTEVLSSLESIKSITASARGSWRPSNLVEGASKLDGSGRLLRGVSESLKKLADASDISNQAWVSRWEDYNNASGFVRKVAAAINLTSEFVDAVQNAETSSAEEKLRAMSQIMKDISTLVPSSTGVGAYVNVLASAVEGIAEDAAVIEAATKRTNETIALVNKMIVGEDTTEPAGNPRQSAIDEIESRIRELENRAARRQFAEAYDKITEAESACSQELNISMDDISELRRTLAAATREVRNIEAAKSANSQLVPSLNLLIEATRAGIVEARTDMQNPEKVLAAYRRIERLEHELTLYQTELRNAERVVTERNLTLNIDLIISQQKMEKSASALAAFDECVQNHLGEPDVVLDDLIGTYFPQYKNSGGTVFRSAPGDVWLGKWAAEASYDATTQVWRWWFTVSRKCGEFSIQTHTSGPDLTEILRINSTNLEFLFHDELGTRIYVSMTGGNVINGTVSQPNNTGLPRGRVAGNKIDSGNPDNTGCSGQICSWQSTGMISDHTGDDAPPVSVASEFPRPARCNADFSGFTATCWDGVSVTHPESPDRAWCTYKNITLPDYGDGVAAGKVYECSCTQEE